MKIPTASREVLWLPSTCSSALSLGWLAVPAFILGALLTIGERRRRKYFTNTYLDDGRQVLDCTIGDEMTPEELALHQEKIKAYSVYYDLPYSERKKANYLWNHLQRKYPGPSPFIR